MGRLPALSTGAASSGRASSGRASSGRASSGRAGEPLPRALRCGTLVLGLLAAPLACDSSAEVPAKSRVQSVLAEPEPHAGGGAGPGAASTAATAPATVTKVAEPPPPKPRPPLCDGQLAAKPRAFKPKLPPRQLSDDAAAAAGAAGGSPLPADPVKAARGRWHWINFWAAWCVPCREELPLLFSWQEQLGERVAFSFVSLDDDERQLHAFLEKQPPTGLRRTQWLPDGAVRLAWLEALGLETEPELPFQVLIDPKGMLRCRVGGAVEAKDLAVLRQLIAAKK
jgi:thiol-disulfide isomerase/thioredoxin